MSQEKPDLDLHELANRGGFGRAKDELQRAGYWDEHAGAGPEREFTVYLNAMATVSAVLIVKARSRAEAGEKAIAQVPGRWEVEDPDDLEVRVTTVLDSAKVAE